MVDEIKNCSYCNQPGPKHEGGGMIRGISVSGVFCNKICFEKWLVWKSAVLSWLDGGKV